MIIPFTKYFIRHMLVSRKRGGILILAVIGIIISSFALVVLQGVMDGLQRNLMGRSKRILGSGVFYFHQPVEKKTAKPLKSMAERLNFKAVREYELEALIKNSTTFVPAIIHAIDPLERPFFLNQLVLDDLAVPFGLSLNLDVKKNQQLLLISPAHIDSLVDDIPRSVSGSVSEIFTTQVPELDETRLWVRMGLVHNLIKSPSINAVRFYGPGNWMRLSQFVQDGPYKNLGRLLQWEDVHKTLVWALKLESRVMIFLFTSMALLVSLCVTSGLMIFFDKMKNDMLALWILGASTKALYKASQTFLLLLSFTSSLLGLSLGVLFLVLFDRYSPAILPGMFVDRKLPVELGPVQCLTAFLIPFSISLFFGHFSLKNFKGKQNNERHLAQLRNSSLV